jgi:putative acetyltransferase
MEIHAYRDGDAPALLDLFQRSIRGIACRDYTPAQIAAWSAERDPAAWEAHRASRPTFIAEIDGRPAGFADLEANGHVDMLFVDPAAQRRGVARALLAHAEREARALGLRRLTTEASITARPAFEACGFHVVAPQQVSFGGETFVNYRMEKTLGG